MYLAQKQTFGFKLETAIGTVETLDATTVKTRCWGMPNALKVTRNKIARLKPGALGNMQSAKGDSFTDLSFYLYAHGKGATGVPAWADLLAACWMPVTGTTHETSDDQAEHATISAAHWIDGLKWIGRGLMGSWRLTAEVGRPWKLDFTFQGGDVAPALSPAAESDPSGTYEDVRPPTWEGADAFLLDGDELFVARAEIDLGNQLSRREDANSAGGYHSGFVGQRLPKITIEPETGSDFPAFTRHEAGTQFDVVMAVGTVAGNTITLTASDCETEATPDPQDRGGRLVDALTLDVHGGIAIAFT